MLSSEQNIGIYKRIQQELKINIQLKIKLSVKFKLKFTVNNKHTNLSIEQFSIVEH